MYKSILGFIEDEDEDEDEAVCMTYNGSNTHGVTSHPPSSQKPRRRTYLEAVVAFLRKFLVRNEMNEDSI